MKRYNAKVKFMIWVMVAVMLTGCGSVKESSADAVAYEEMSYDGMAYATNDIYMQEMPAQEAIMDTAVTEESAAEAGSTSATVEVKDTQSDRKLIKTVDLQVETETFDELLVKVGEKTEDLGGYIENSYMYNGSSYYGETHREANLTIRVPAENLDTFLSAVSAESNIISRNDNVTDVTLQYVDMESRKEALTVEQNRLLELLARAENMEDIIAIESRLSEVRYQLESMESQLRTMDNQVSYSTVYLYIQEVAKLTPVKEQSVFEQIVTGFTENLYGVGNDILDFIIGFIIYIPYLVVWAVVMVAILFIIKGIIKLIKKRKAKKQEKKALKEQKKAEAQAKNAENETVE